MLRVHGGPCPDCVLTGHLPKPILVRIYLHYEQYVQCVSSHSLTGVAPTIMWSVGALKRYVQEERVRPLPLGKCMTSHVQLHIKANRRRRCNASCAVMTLRCFEVALLVSELTCGQDQFRPATMSDAGCV